MCPCERKRSIGVTRLGNTVLPVIPESYVNGLFLHVCLCVLVMEFTFASFQLHFVTDTFFVSVMAFLRIIFPHFSIHLRDYVYLRYYPALRTLEQLERTCLPKAGQYRFCSIMSENIPKLRTQIRDTAMTQLRDFLESIRKHSDKIGEAAIKQVHKRILFELRRRELTLVLLACFIFVLH